MAGCPMQGPLQGREWPFGAPIDISIYRYVWFPAPFTVNASNLSLGQVALGLPALEELRLTNYASAMAKAQVLAAAGWLRRHAIAIGHLWVHHTICAVKIVVLPW